MHATIVDESSGVKQAALNWTINNGTWFAAPMAHLEENIWYGTIPQLQYGTNVTYFVTAKDHTNNIVTTEGSEYECEYTVIPEFSSLIILPLFAIATLLACMIAKGRLAIRARRIESKKK